VPFWNIGEHTRLYTPAEAERLQLRIKGKWQPPQPPPDGGTGTTPGGDMAPPPVELIEHFFGGGRPGRIEGSGPPAQAFQQIWDQCEEHEVIALRRLHLSFSGFTKSHADSLAAVGLAIPQMGRAEFVITLKLTIQFDPPPGEQFALEFQGSWDRYKRLKQITDSFAREEVHSRLVEFRLLVDFGQGSSRQSRRCWRR
jgi:hypothetical protein